jgi:polar amino acid transport system substrate-binding protein
LPCELPQPLLLHGTGAHGPAKDTETTIWSDLDKKGKKIAVSQGTTGALLAKQIYKEATVLDFPTFPEASAALVQGEADGIVYDEPGIRMYEIMHKEGVRGIYDLISSENLGMAVRLNDFAFIQWLNSFLFHYLGSPQELESREKWFNSTEWMQEMAQ